MHIGKRNLKAKYSLIGKVIEETDAEKDLGEKTYKWPKIYCTVCRCGENCKQDSIVYQTTIYP